MSTISIAEQVAAAAIPQDQADVVIAQLEAAYAAAYAARRDQLIGRAADISYHGGHDYSITAVLSRAFGKFAAVTGPEYGISLKGYTKATVREHIGGLDSGETNAD